MGRGSKRESPPDDGNRQTSLLSGQVFFFLCRSAFVPILPIARGGRNLGIASAAVIFQRREDLVHDPFGRGSSREEPFQMFGGDFDDLFLVALPDSNVSDGAPDRATA